MALTNAQKQERWRERNQVLLKENARRIAAKLIAMDDEEKLRKVLRYITDHLNERAATTKHERKA